VLYYGVVKNLALSRTTVSKLHRAPRIEYQSEALF